MKGGGQQLKKAFALLVQHNHKIFQKNRVFSAEHKICEFAVKEINNFTTITFNWIKCYKCENAFCGP